MKLAGVEVPEGSRSWTREQIKGSGCGFVCVWFPDNHVDLGGAGPGERRSSWLFIGKSRLAKPHSSEISQTSTKAPTATAALKINQ